MFSYQPGFRGWPNRLRLPLFQNEGDERHDAGALERRSQLALVPGTIAGDAAGDDLSPLVDELPEAAHILIVDLRYLIDAEGANLPAPLPLFLRHDGSSSKTRPVPFAAVDRASMDKGLNP